MILVLAGTYEQFLRWCTENGKKKTVDAVYVRSEQSLKGWEKPTLIRTGEWWKNPASGSFDELETYLHVMYPETRVRTFPPVTERVESGPIRFGEDWPGLFIRGDNAFALRMLIDDTLKVVPDTFLKRSLESLANFLDECNLNPQSRRNPVIKIEVTPNTESGKVGNA